MNTITRFHQRGLAIVEIAIVGALMMMMLFALIEFGRMLWTWGTLAEVTRHAARAAAVCTRDNNAVYNVAVFGNIHGKGSAILPDLTKENIKVEYIQMEYVDNQDDSDGEPQWVRIVSMVETNEEIEFVRVSIVDYQIRLAIPILNVSLTSPPFATTQPAESLGKVITCRVY